MIVKFLVTYLAIFITLIITGCASQIKVEEQRAQAEAHYDLGVSLLNRGKFIDALAALEKAKTLYPHDPRIYNAIGLVYFGEEKFDTAAQNFQKAIQLNGDFVEAHNNLGAAYSRMGMWDRAIKEYRIALSDPLYRTPALAHYNIGYALLEKGDLVEALEEFRIATNIYPDFDWAVNKYGVALFRLNRVHEAIKKFKQAIEINPNYVEPYSNLGLAYMKLGEREEAIKQFKEVLRLAPEGSELANNARRYLDILE